MAQTPYDQQHYENFLYTERMFATVHNTTVIDRFTRGLDYWRQNTLINRSLGKPGPAKPEVPTLVAIDVDKLNESFWKWFNAPSDFEPDGRTPGRMSRPEPTWYVYTLMPVASNAFDLAEPPKPVVPFDDSNVLDLDPTTPNRFEAAAHDQTPHGIIVNHSVHGKLMKQVFKNPFGLTVYFVKVNPV
jgi:hypothetical protein